MPLELRRHPRTKIWQITGTQIVPGKERGISLRQSTRTTDRAEAERFLEAARRRIIDGASLGASAVYTVAEAIEYYMEKTGREDPHLLPILQRFGHARVADLSDKEVSDYAGQRFVGLKPSSVKRVFYTPLNAVIAKSAKKGLCPYRAFDAPKVVREPARWASEMWWSEIQPYAGPDVLFVAAFMMTTSARVTEALNVTIADIDLGARTCLLRKTKTGSPRLVFLSPFIAQKIAEAIERHGLAINDRLFWMYSARWSVNQALERAAKRAGIEYLSSHQVGRHTFAARYLANGGSLKGLMEAGGWASIRIVAETYGHLERSHVETSVRDATCRIEFTPRKPLAIANETQTTSDAENE